MGTFIVRLLIVFLPFIWFIIRALHYTDETVGENSPLYRERTYQLSASQYFVTFDKVMWMVLFVMMWVVCWVISRAAVRQDLPWLFLFVCFFAAFALHVVYVFYVDWQYWMITRNVVLTLNPFEPSIHVDGPDQGATLRPGNLAHIELHLRKSSNYKELLHDYGYSLFYTTDGATIRVNRRFFLHINEFLERHFSQIPELIVWHELPPITPMIGVQK